MANLSITATSFLPGTLKVKEVVGTILAEMKNRQSEKLIDLFNKTIQHWNEPPKFVAKFSFSGGNAVLWAVATGDDHDIWKWIWLDEGTSVRHAILSDDWQSKTSVGSLVSGSGSGYVTAINSNYLGAGIDPRNFAEQITEEMEKTFAADIQAAIDRGIDLAEKKGKGKILVS